MGARQSSNTVEDADNNCHPCFGISAPLNRINKSNDLLGSPVPDTPVRKKREFSSRYDGLEKEVVATKLKSKITSADVHEGSVRDLH